MAAARASIEQSVQRADWRVVTACCVAGSAAWLEPPATIFRPPSELAFGSGWVGFNVFLGIVNLLVIAFYLAGGSLGDVFGRRRVLLIGLAGVLAGNALLMLSPNTVWFVTTRLLTGLAGALAVPLTLSLVYLTFAGNDERLGRAITLYIVASAIAGVGGGLLGGLLRALPDWRLAFVPSMVCAVLGMLLVRLNVPESKAPPGERDVALGNTASTWILLALAFGIHVVWVAGPYAGYVLAASLAAASVGVLLLVRSDRRAAGGRFAHRWRSRWNLTLLTVFGVALQIALTGYLTQTQSAVHAVYGYGGLVAVLALAPFVVGTLLNSHPAFQRLTSRLGPLSAMALGVGLVGLSCLGTWFLFGSRNYLFLAVLLLATGIGSTMADSAWTSTFLRSVPGALIGARTGMNSAIKRTGDLIGTTLTSALLATAGSSDYVRRLLSEGVGEERLEQAREALDRLLDPATVAAAAGDPAIVDLLLSEYRLSYAAAYERVMLVLALICLLASLLAWIAWWRRGPSPAGAAAPQDRGQSAQ